MSYFPFFMNISGKPGLIVGGGRIALRKIEKLLPFAPKLKVIAPVICSEIRGISGPELIQRSFEAGDEAGNAFVIAATDDRELNRKISQLCGEKNIPVNVVDDAELCSFIFPSLVKRGELTIGISTGGISPTAAVCIKEKINEILPENFEEILDCLYEARKYIKTSIASEQERHIMLRHLFFACMNAGRRLTESEAEIILREAKDE